MYKCKCKLLLQPVQWKENRLLWCCPKIAIPVSMRPKNYKDQSKEDYCDKVIEFLNNNEKSILWQRFNRVNCNNLSELCKSYLNQPCSFNHKIFINMIHCLNSYDTNMDELYASATKKRSAKVVTVKPNKRKTKRRKLDKVASQGQLVFEDLKSIKISTKRSDKMKKSIEEAEEKNRLWLEENFKSCNCTPSTLLAKQTVKEFDDQGNRKKNAFRKFWSCRNCNFFLWEDDLFHYYNKFKC